MTYKFKYSKQVTKQLKKLDKSIEKRITQWIDKNIKHSENPRAKGKPLVANHKREWRYRIGDYRLICDIRDNELTILALAVGHRNKIYKKDTQSKSLNDWKKEINSSSSTKTTKPVKIPSKKLKTR